MTKLTRFLIAAAIISVAAVVAGTHPQRGRSASLALLFLLLAALVAAGMLAFRSRTAEQRTAAKNLSPSLATLSSAAILAVYAAGYHRTSGSAGGFSEESGRRSAPVVVASAAAPPSSQHQIEPLGQDAHTPALVIPPAGSQQKNRLPGDHAATSNTSASSNGAPVEYATARSVTPQTTASRGIPAPATAAPQIAMTGSDPDIQVAAPAAPASQAKPRYKDGTYSGWGSCRHGDIQASVSIQEGKISSVAITQCLTRYSCSWISDLPNQVVKRQSPEVDYVSGASQSTDAFYGAVVSALSQARN
jgi:uncharacterized protein with FMN-binding domain